MIRLNIAGKILDTDIPDKFLHESFKPFLSEDDGEADMLFMTCIENKTDIPKEMILSGENGTASDNDVIRRVFVSKDHRKAVFELSARYESVYAGENNSPDELETVKKSILDSFGKVFFTAVTAMGLFVLRSSAVVINDMAYVFAAPQGAGKTSHTEKWIRYFNAERITGNVTVLELSENENGTESLFAYGLPWGHETETVVNVRVRVASVCFLRIHFENEIRKTTVGVASENLMKNAFDPEMAKEFGDAMKDFSVRGAKAVTMFLFGCMDNKAAAKLSYRFMTGVYVRG